MQSQKRIFDDIAKVAGGALGALGSLKQEIESLVKQRVDRFMTDHDLVSREEFEAVKAMASEARAEQERISARLAALEGGPAKASARKQPTPKRTTGSKKPASSKAKKKA
ncbi:MAG: accessory factor UbiK family protein [Alphaproteobacteria bacterium]|nr:accessory factor UbiK family protein [Alphaproteobacteria bacterium]